MPIFSGALENTESLGGIEKFSTFSGASEMPTLSGASENAKVLRVIGKCQVFPEVSENCRRSQGHQKMPNFSGASNKKQNLYGALEN